MIRRLALTSVFLLVALTAVAEQTYTDAQLYSEGKRAWEGGACVRAAEFFFAYLVRNPGVQNQHDGVLMQQAIDWCEKNTAVGGGSKGDNPNDRGRSNTQPRPFLVLPTSVVEGSAPQQRRCDSYARIAVAQAGIFLANRCGGASTRWDLTYANHFNWCSAQSDAGQVRAETAARQQVLDTSCAP